MGIGWRAAMAGTLAAAGMASAAIAQEAQQHVRGEVRSLTADTVVVRTRTGRELDVKLTPDWRVAAIRRVDLSAIKPGSFIGTTTIEKADGTGRSLEVHVFPPGVKMGAGHYDWDLRPHSMMTNGDVGKVVASPKGDTVEVSYPGGSHTVVVPKGAPVVETVPGTRDMVRPGAKVFIIAARQPTGALSANTVVVGEKGAPPPM